MGKVCDCSAGPSNSGVPLCPVLMDVTKMLFRVPLVADDGTQNVIPVSTTLDAAYFTARLNDVDPSKRWYPTGLLDNVENLRADSIFEGLNSGKQIFIQEGVRSFVGQQVKFDPQYKAVMDSWSCGESGVFVVDKSRNLAGIISSDGVNLEPMPFDPNTNDGGFTWVTDTTTQKVSVKFEFSDTMRDEEIKQFNASEITGVDLLTLGGLLDVSVVVSSESVTTFTLDLTQAYGSAAIPNRVEGWVIGDFTLAEITPSPAPIVITSVTESAAGVYDFVFPTETTADVLSVTGQKDGFIFPATSVTIP